MLNGPLKKAGCAFLHSLGRKRTCSLNGRTGLKRWLDQSSVCLVRSNGGSTTVKRCRLRGNSCP